MNNSRAEIIREISDLLTRNKNTEAEEILNCKYPFNPLNNCRVAFYLKLL